MPNNFQLTLKGCSKWVALHNHYLKESSHCSCHQRDHDFTLLEFRAVGTGGGGGQGGPTPGYPNPPPHILAGKMAKPFPLQDIFYDLPPLTPRPPQIFRPSYGPDQTERRFKKSVE